MKNKSSKDKSRKDGQKKRKTRKTKSEQKTMKQRRKEKMAYKCPFVNCNVKNSKTDFMDEHFREAEHNTNDFELKCPIEKCKNLNNCELHFEKRYAKFLRYVKFQEIAIENFNRNYKELVFDDLITSRDTIATIIKTFIINGKIKTYDSKNRISCPVIGCNKRYKQFPGYVYHTKNYKHPISEMISEYSRIDRLEMDNEKLKQELADEKYVNGFVLMDVKHYSEKNVFTEKPIYFKNDFYTADARKDKFIYKKGTPNIDNSYISLFKSDLTPNNVIHNLIYKGEKFSEKQGTLAFALNFLNLNEFISCAFYDKDSKKILVSTRSSKDPELLYTFKSYTSRLSVLDLNLNIKKIITFDFGSVIKIRPAYDGLYFMLFKDGKLRLVDLETEDTKELIENQFIDFEIIDKDVIVCTDGIRVYKIEKYDDYFVTQSDHLPHAINCITVRKIQKTNKHRNYLLEKTRNSFQIHNEHNNDLSVNNSDTNDLSGNNSDTNDLSGNNSDTNDKLYIVNEEKNTMLEEIREKLSSYRIFCNTVEGNLYAFSDDLSDYIDILNIHSQKVDYLEDFDVFIVTDSINDKTKVLTIENEFIKTHLFRDSMSFSNCTALGTIVTAGFNGVIQQNWINYHKVKNINLMQFYRSGYDLLILDRIDEFNLLNPREEFDYSTLAVYLFEEDHYLYTFLSSGVILKKLIKS